jgi:hypothetical protein
MTDLITKLVAASALDSAQIVSISERLSFMLVYNTGRRVASPSDLYVGSERRRDARGDRDGVAHRAGACRRRPRATLPLALVTGGRSAIWPV